MQHAVGMRDLERMRDAREDVRNHIEREVAVVLAQEPFERRPLHVLHDEVRRGILDLEVVHRDDVRIAELGNRPSFRETGDVRGNGILGRAEIFGAFGIGQILGNVLPRGDVLKANDLRRRRRRGLAFGSRIAGRLRWVGGCNPTREIRRCARQLDALDGDLAAHLRIPCDLHRRETTRASLRHRAITIEYELFACHATPSPFELRLLSRSIAKLSPPVPFNRKMRQRTALNARTTRMNERTSLRWKPPRPVTTPHAPNVLHQEQAGNHDRNREQAPPYAMV